ncbi:MAG: 50S ribosomal protein L33 [Fidelibacterota bacterium]
MAGSSRRDIIRLECEQCHHRNYSATKNKRTQPDRVEYKKYCPTCRSHTLHRETR